MKKFKIILLSLVLLCGCKPQKKYLQLEVKKEEKVLRQAAVAGAFYPADKTTLEDKINSFLDKTKVIAKEKLSILVVPHAGYNYSGQTAAWGFKQIPKDKYLKVIILGASHQAYFNNVAIYNQGAWQTPLGEVEVEESLANNLIKQSKFFKANLEAHKLEHSLEVELPFLQQTLASFKIVPILLGQVTPEVEDNLAQAIADNFDEHTLLVISSDLAHYPQYKIANQVDKNTIEAILTGEVPKFKEAMLKGLELPGVETCACGEAAIKIGMMIAQKLNLQTIKLIDYHNSGDITSDQSRVVGYAAIGFYENSLRQQLKTEIFLSQEQQKKLLQIARETLEKYLKNQKIPEYKIEDQTLLKPLGAFVTLSKDGELRGCIGEFEPEKPLWKVVQNKALDAASHDPRFSPVTYHELKDIKIEISVLSPQEKIDDWKKIALGKHGVVIKRGFQGGTFLPQVAKETNWDLETFLSNLCFNKAGLEKECYKDPKTKIYIFTAQVFSE